MWDELISACALVLVLEGIMPFISPSKWRDYIQRIAEMNDHTIRVIGLISMLIGMSVLFIVRAVD